MDKGFQYSLEDRGRPEIGVHILLLDTNYCRQEGGFREKGRDFKRSIEKIVIHLYFHQVRQTALQDIRPLSAGKKVFYFLGAQSEDQGIDSINDPRPIIYSFLKTQSDTGPHVLGCLKHARQ